MSLNSRGGHQLLWRNNANGDLIDWQTSGGQIAAVATIATKVPVTYQTGRQPSPPTEARV